MAEVVARYLLDEASSGTTPTTCADDTGNGNTLAIDYSSGDLEWTSDATGNGLDFLAAPNTSNSAIVEIDDIATNGTIGSSLDGANQVWSIMVLENISGHNFGMRLVAIGTDSGNTDFSTIKEAGTRWVIRWDREAGGDGIEIDFDFSLPTGLFTVIVQIDTTETDATGGVKLWVNGSAESNVAGGGSYVQNSTLDGVNSTNRNFSIGNRGSQNRNIQGQIYYASIGTGLLTDFDTISNIHDALIADNDSDWQAGGGSYTLTCESGTYSQSGTNAALLAARLLSADGGTYNHSGAIANLNRGRILEAGSGAYIQSGASVELTASRLLVADSGAYIQTGTAATLTYTPVTGSYTLIAESGSYAQSGTEADLIASRIISASSGNYTLSGTAVGLNRGYQLSAESGSYSQTGTDLSILASRVITATSGTYSMVGTDAVLTYSGQVVWTVQPNSTDTWSLQSVSSDDWSVQTNSSDNWTVQ